MYRWSCVKKGCYARIDIEGEKDDAHVVNGSGEHKCIKASHKTWKYRTLKEKSSAAAKESAAARLTAANIFSTVCKK